MKHLTILLAAFLILAQSNILSAQESVVLNKIHIDETDRSLSYNFNIEDNVRTIKYTAAGKGALKVIITDEKDKVLTEVLATEESAQVKMLGQEFTIAEGQVARYPRNADAASVYLLHFNYLSDQVVGTNSLLAWLKDLARQNQINEADYSIATDILGGIIGGLIDLHDWLQEDANCTPDQETCMYTDINGSLHEIIHECDCGEAVCEKVFVTSAIVTLTVNVDTGDQNTTTEYKFHSYCKCECLKTTFYGEMGE